MTMGIEAWQFTRWRRKPVRPFGAGRIPRRCFHWTHCADDAERLNTLLVNFLVEGVGTTRA
jgi:hypothetical protein